MCWLATRVPKLTMQLDRIAVSCDAEFYSTSVCGRVCNPFVYKSNEMSLWLLPVS